MKRLSILLLFFALILLGKAQTSAQPSVFVNAYNNEIFGKDLVFTGGGDLLIAGDKLRSAHASRRGGSDFGLMRVDSLGHPLLTKVYHFQANDRMAYVKNAPHGYVWGGMSAKNQQKVPHLLILARTNQRGQLRWSKAFAAPGRNSIRLTGLDVNRKGEIVFAAIVHSPATSTSPASIAGIVAKLDSAGSILWARKVGLGNRFPLDTAPRTTVHFGPYNSVLAGWQFGRQGHPELTGVNFQIYGPAGTLRRSHSYRANGLLAMTYVAADSSIAAYALDSLNRSGLIRLDSVGGLRFAFLDNLQASNALSPRPHVQIMADGPRIPYSAYNQLTNFVGPSPALATQLPAIQVEAPAGMSDFVVRGRQAYMIGTAYYPPNQRRYPILLKSAFAQVDNCFTRGEHTKIRARFPIAPLPLALAPTAYVLRDSMIRLRVRTIRSKDSLACIGDGDVWPGDANSDGIAQVRDLFAIGLAWGRQGPQRPNASINWTGQPARNWGRTFFNGADIKHADCNGNGRVGTADILAILANYGQIHLKNAPNGNPSDAPLFVDLLSQNLQRGQLVQVPVHLGDVQVQSDDIYGLSFTVNYDPAVVGTDLVFVPATSWLGQPGRDLQYLQKNFPQSGELEVALVRTDGQDAQGAGLIGYLSFSLNSTAEEQAPLHISLNQPQAINSQEEEFLLYAMESQTEIAPQQGVGSVDAEAVSAASNIELYPNPAASHVNVNLRDVEIQGAEIVDLYGKRLWQASPVSRQFQITLPRMPEGLYFLKLYTAEGVVMKRFRKE